MIASIVTLLVMILSSVTGGYGVATADPQHYANQLPYGSPASTPVKAPPRGYHLAFVETVGRHGARTLTSSGRERRSLQVWDAARKRDAVTEVGEGFPDDVAAFKVPEQRIGYGNLTALGATEWRGIGRRTAQSYGDLLTEAAADGDEIAFETSGVQRTVESADAMREGLAAVVPGLRVADAVTDPATLLIGNGASLDGNHAVERIETSPQVVGAAKHLLGQMYDRAYVDTIEDPVQAALDIYLLYATAPGLAGETTVTFADYVPPADATVLAYAVDAENFYQYGPGVAGQDSSYAAARPLLADFFTRLDERLDGGRTAAVFRLAHGETTMPFAALLDLPGSRVQAPKGADFTYADNPWRGSVAGRLSGSIEWTAYTDADGRALVTVRHNERPVELAKRCRATVPYFYRVAELKRCLG